MIHSLEVCKYNFTETGVAVFQNLYTVHWLWVEKRELLSHQYK